MPRILVLNNYCLDRVWGEVRRGEKPDHHLFGLNYFESHGFDVEIVSWRNHGGWQRVQALMERVRFPIPLGDFSQQADAARRRKSVDLIYAPCQTQLHLLAYLRRTGLWKVPLVAIAHHPFEVGRLSQLRRPFLRAGLLGVDAFPSLSTFVSAEISNIAGLGGQSVLPWGPQRDFYPVVSRQGQGVVAAGRTGRDFVTFGRAASRAGIAARILCLDENVKPEFAGFGANVRVEVFPSGSPADYRQLVEAYSEARVLAIPMLAQSSMVGLTSLMDALGMGKPVIITRNKLIDLDVEKLGIGRWVEPGDETGWVDALRWFEANPGEAMQMGRRARALVDGGLNSEQFALKVVDIFKAVLNKNGNGRKY